MNTKYSNVWEVVIMRVITSQKLKFQSMRVITPHNVFLFLSFFTT